MRQLPQDILQDPALLVVIDMIESGGHHAYLVGGAVRNALLGQPVMDIDIATNARPETIVELAKERGLKTVPTGIDHGTVTVISDGKAFEVTTFRRDVETDGRRAVVAFADDLAEDAMRRDFTMNALYADRSGQVIDPVGGLPDLEARRLRFVGEARQRIREDYLRILRFFRFLAWYGRETSQEAIDACAELKTGLNQIARERIGAEMKKLLAAPNPSGAIKLMDETGVLAQLLPGADANALAELVAREGGAPPSWHRRLVALAAGTDTRERLRFSNKEARIFAALTLAIAESWSLDEAGYRLGASLGQDYALLTDQSGISAAAKLEHAAASKLPVSAADLMPKLKGPDLGKSLKAAEKAWIKSGFNLGKAELIEAALLETKE